MDDPDATVVRAPRPARGLAPATAGAGATVVPPRAAAATPFADGEATIVRAHARSATPESRAATGADADATTIVRPRGPSSAAADFDPDATVIRLITPPGGAGDTTRTVVRESAPMPRRAPLALPSGFPLLEYRIERVLGQGGFGITYLAVDVNLDAKVAIKEYLPEEIAFRAGDRSVSPNASQHRDRYRQGLDNFLAEARTLATFRHPNIVRVARFFEAHRTAYMVLEYERGQPLKQWWPAHADEGERALVERLQPLLDGLAVVHAAGYLHRDIKPDNIQVREDDGRFVLLDFGSSGQTVALADQDAVVVTPGYAPIEQYGRGDQGAWSDIYALGATLYWAVAGSKPPDAEARAAGAPMTPAVQAGAGRFGRKFLEAIDWALQMDPRSRPASLEQWRRRLFADHLGSLGLQEALQHGEATLVDVPAGAASRIAARARALLSRVLSPSSWPLAAKLTLAMLATALVPMLLTASYNLQGAQSALQSGQLHLAELMARNTAGRLAQLLGDSANLARALGSDAAFARGLTNPDDATLRETLRERMVGLARANRDVHLVMLMDAAGATRISSDPDLVGRNFGFREYFREAMAGRPFVTGVVVGAAAGAAGVFFSEPVKAGDGSVIGAVVLRIRASSFAAILDEVRHESVLTPFLIDADGVLVHHPRENLLYRSLAPLAPDAQARIKADQRFRRDRIESLNEPQLAQAMLGAQRTGHVAYRSSISGVDEIAGFAPVPGHHWVVGVTETRASFEAPIARLREHLLWSVGLVGALFTLLALHVSRGIVRPVRALTDGANALKAGDFDRARVQVKSRDELGQLARTFNVMVDVLRQRERSQRG